MPRHSYTSPSLRQLRVGEELRHVISWILERGELQDPDLTGRAVTVTEVRTSPDLKQALIYVVPLAGENEESIVSALNRAKGFVRRRVGQQVRLKFLPDLSFRLDTSFDEADRISGLLRDPKVARDLQIEPSTEESPKGADFLDMRRDDEGS